MKTKYKVIERYDGTFSIYQKKGWFGRWTLTIVGRGDGQSVSRFTDGAEALKIVADWRREDA
jgi:hypothetical protein